MPAEFHESGICFQYPENWKLQRDEIDAGWIVEIQSPDTAFLMVCLRTDGPRREELLEQSLSDLREDYPELEADAATSTIAGADALGYDVSFFSLDFTNTCIMRSFLCPAGTMLVLWQVTDVDAERLEPVLNAIVASLRADR
jgi:hypothetical protein